MAEDYNRESGVPGLKDVQSAAMRHLIGTRCLSSAGLAIGSSSKAAVLIGSTTTFTIGGVIYTKTTAEIAFTDLTVQPISSTRYYLLSLNASGTGLISTGTSTELPNPPAGYCPIGYVKVVTSAAGTFIPATTLLDATQVTETYVNISVLPLTLS